MDEERIKSDFKVVLERLEKLVLGVDSSGSLSVENMIIFAPDYIYPTLYADSDKPIPLGHEIGAFVYYMGILSGLSEAIRTGQISEHKRIMENVRPPHYIKELFI